MWVLHPITQCSHAQGTPKSTLRSHPFLLPLLRLGPHPSLHQHLHMSLYLLSGGSPSSPPPLHAAVALSAYISQSAFHSSCTVTRLLPEHTALQCRSHPTCIRHQANRYFTVEVDLILLRMLETGECLSGQPEMPSPPVLRLCYLKWYHFR